MKVLIVTGGYLPGYRYGGPVRSLAAIVEHLGDDIDFSVVASNHDLGDPTPYPGVKSDTWTRVGKAEVWYASAKPRSLFFWRQMLAQCTPDVIYLNSFFSPMVIVLLVFMRLGFLPALPVLLAPRGQFSKGALGIKSPKKRAYVALARILGLPKRLSWHVSSSAEAEDLNNAIPEATHVYTAPNLFLRSHSESVAIEKQAGEMRVVFIARVSPMKNLLGALEFLQDVSGNVTFDAYGPLEDKEYWGSCLEAVSQLPPNVVFSYRGELPHDRVAQTLTRYHFFLLPTLGENFGHSIAESLQQGRPALISDRTPWRHLETAGVGWDLKLEDTGAWRRALRTCVGMDNDTYQTMSFHSRGFAERWVVEQGGVDANLQMFRSVAALRV